MPVNATRAYPVRQTLALWLLALLVSGCTSGAAEPIFAATSGSVSTGAAGHRTVGAAGAAGGAGAGNSGAAGNAGNSDAGPNMSQRVMPGEASSRTLDDDDDAGLLALMNDAIDNHHACPDKDHPLTRMELPSGRNDTLSCYSRNRAHVEFSGMAWVKPQASFGPGHDPFAPVVDIEQILETGPTTPSMARDKFLADGQACMKLQMPKYTSWGIGHEGNVWVITLAGQR